MSSPTINWKWRTTLTSNYFVKWSRLKWPARWKPGKCTVSRWNSLLSLMTDLEDSIGPHTKIKTEGSSDMNIFFYWRYESCLTNRSALRYMAVTQFESADARRAFPCFDEPNMKANFTMTIGRKESMTSVSNMPLLRTEPMWVISFLRVRQVSELITSLILQLWCAGICVGHLWNIRADVFLSCGRHGLRTCRIPRWPKTEQRGIPDLGSSWWTPSNRVRRV